MATPITKKRYKISGIMSETPEVLLVKLVPDDGQPMDFEPGMFAMLHGIEAGTGKVMIGRAFSIASEPMAKELEFYIVKEHNGHQTHFLGCKNGDEFQVVGPHGQFKFVPDSKTKALFIAGGTGLAPFMSMLRFIKSHNTGTNVTLMYSVKYPTEIIRRDELDDFEKSIGTKVVVTVTRPPEGTKWLGETGRINADMISKYVPDVHERLVCICGPLPFVNAMKDALKSLKVSDSMVRADVWG